MGQHSLAPSPAHCWRCFGGAGRLLARADAWSLRCRPQGTQSVGAGVGTSQPSRSVYTSHSQSRGSGARVKSQRGQAITSPASSRRWEGLVGTQSAMGRAPGGHCSQAVWGGCSSILLAPCALLRILLLHGSQLELAEDAGEGETPRHGGHSGAHMRPARSTEQERAGSSEAPSSLTETQP